MLEDAFDPTAVAAMVDAIDPLEAQMEEVLQQQEGGKLFIARANEITFTTHLVTRSEVLRTLVATSPLRELAGDLIGPDVRLYWDQAVYKKPDTAASFPWHQDNGYAFLEPQQYLTCWIALTDATRENGCPWVVPGLHRLGTLAHRLTDTGFVCLENPPDAVAVPAPGRQHRGLLVADTPLHRPQPHRRGAQGLHRPVRPRWRRGADGRRRRRGGPVPGRRRPAPVPHPARGACGRPRPVWPAADP